MSIVDAAHLSDLDVIARLAVALGVGASIGLERELDGQEAGLRTHALLALGAGMFGVISVGAFGSFASDTPGGNVQIDVTRIASYVAAGIGFLAGGAIVKGTTRIKGLTTAASLWVCAAAGLAAGLGFYVGAIAGTVAALVMLLLDRPLSGLRRSKERVALHVHVHDEESLAALLAAVLDADDGNYHPTIRTRRERDGEDGIDVDISGVRLPTARHLLTKLSAMPSVDEVSLISD
jgi:putative Mg2+ transporter-C (MgtC) family protein